MKENITFGRLFDSKRYEAALGAAQLSRDLGLLPAGDETEIGEKGVNLSGGQKARVALARCVYGFRVVGRGADEVDKQSTSIALLDDPLGALDASTALKIFDALFGSNAQDSECTSSGVLRSGASVLVTHATHFLPRPEVTRILVLKSKDSNESQGESKSADTGRSGRGNVIFNGTWNELIAAAQAEDKSNGNATPLSDLIASAVAPHGENDDEAEDVDTKKEDSVKSVKPLGSSKHGSLIKVEQVIVFFRQKIYEFNCDNSIAQLHIPCLIFNSVKKGSRLRRLGFGGSVQREVFLSWRFRSPFSSSTVPRMPSRKCTWPSGLKRYTKKSMFSASRCQHKMRAVLP